MEVLRKQLSEVRTPQLGDKVYKNECAFSFDNPVSIFLSAPYRANIASWCLSCAYPYISTRYCFLRYSYIIKIGYFIIRMVTFKCYFSREHITLS